MIVPFLTWLLCVKIYVLCKNNMKKQLISSAQIKIYLPATKQHRILNKYACKFYFFSYSQIFFLKIQSHVWCHFHEFPKFADGLNSLFHETDTSERNLQKIVAEKYKSIISDFLHLYFFLFFIQKWIIWCNKNVKRKWDHFFIYERVTFIYFLIWEKLTRGSVFEIYNLIGKYLVNMYIDIYL